MKRYVKDTFVFFFCLAVSGKDEDAGSFLIDITDDKEKAVRHMSKCYLIDLWVFIVVNRFTA